MTPPGGCVSAAERPALFAESVTHRFAQDARGRVVAGPGERAESVPRFYFGRTVGLTLWRFSAALDPESVAGLARLAALERPLPREAAASLEAPPPPERLAALADFLAADAAVETRFRGPLLTLHPAAEARSPTKVGSLRLLAPGERGPGLEAGDARGPTLAAEVAGEVVAACHAVRRWPGWGAEFHVETLESHRGNGYGRAVVRAWSEAVRRAGEIPLARPEWSNHEFLSLARSLGMQLLGEDCEFY